MIDHAAVRELLELAGVEPGGLERLAAGDTPEAAALAGHLAGCPTCSEEARRLAAVGPIVRDAVETIPPDALRDRTLAFVRAVGRPRGAASPATAREPETVAVSPALGGRRSRRWPAAIAAVLVVSLVAGGALVGARLGQQVRDQQVRDQEAQTATLARLNEATLRVTGEPDATRVALAGSEPAIVGTLVFSPLSQELVVSAAGLTEPAAGEVYACWVTGPDGSRARMGRMVFGGGLAYWAGWFNGLANAGPGTQFGVTRVGADGKPVEPGDVLFGSVSSE